MNDDVIVAAYVIVDEAMEALGHRSHRLARLSDAEVLTVAAVAAAYFQNHHERALQVLWGLGYLSARLSTSRFSRRLHALRGWLSPRSPRPRTLPLHPPHLPVAPGFSLAPHFGAAACSSGRVAGGLSSPTRQLRRRRRLPGRPGGP